MRNVYDKIQCALGKKPVDLLIKNANLVNVFSGEIYMTNVAVHDGRIIGFGDYEAHEVIDIKGMYLAPSFIDGHIHIESTMLTVPEFARAVVPYGTGAVVADPHEFANVLGLDGIRYVLEERENLPVDIFVMLPSCVPATELETSGARLSAYDLHLLINEPRVVGVGEMMNYAGVVNGERELLNKLHIGRDKVVDGHAPGLTGKELNAYVLAGPRSDHECTRLEEAREKLRLGMHIHLREGSSEKNLRDILPLVSDDNWNHFSFVTDDRHPVSLATEGHINNNIKIAIESGLDPIRAYQIATINTARFYNLKNLGAIVPRYWADFVVLEDLRNPMPRMVFKKVILVAEDGKALFVPSEARHSFIRATMNIGHIDEDSFKIPAKGRKINLIRVIKGQIVTERVVDDAKIEDGYAVADPERDILKYVVIERHRASGNMGKGFVRGFGIKEGAIASSVAHDSHNLGVLGANDRDMLVAALRATELGGGLVVVKNGEVLAELPLPVAGLVSDQTLETVVEKFSELTRAVESIGCTLPDPFAAMSFLSLVPIPQIRLTDRGLVDATKFEFIDLFADS
ncbi:MAG: adenine deaminase [Thermoprotei archaeon]|nr:MAG: adenine deaminase [Thermoprotei archaeon]